MAGSGIGQFLRGNILRDFKKRVQFWRRNILEDFEKHCSVLEEKQHEGSLQGAALMQSLLLKDFLHFLLKDFLHFSDIHYYN